MARSSRNSTPKKATLDWFEDGVRFRCLFPECGDCCSGKRGPGYVWVGVEEMEALAELLQLEFDAFTRRYVRQVDDRFSLIEKPNTDCIFYEHGTGCTVYEARPTQCRTYPFWPEIMGSRHAWEREGCFCPGIEQENSWVPALVIRQVIELDRARRGESEEE